MRAIVLAALLATAGAAIAYDPVVDTRKILAGTVSTQAIKNEYLSGRRDLTTAFKGALAAYKAVRAAEAPPPPPPITKTCSDGSVIPETQACPVEPPPPPPPPPVQTCPDGSVILATLPCPIPPPPPPPPVTGGWEPSPSIAGRVGIPSNFGIDLELVNKGTIPLPAGVGTQGDPQGAFRFICNPAHLAYDDPIVYPNQPGKSHLHQFYGNTGANAASTYDSLRTSGQSTCMSPLNRSSYWQAAMLDGKGNAVRPDAIAVYYKRRPKSDPKCSLTSGDPQAQGNCVNLPNGLKFIFGYDMITGKAPTGKLWFNCQNQGAVTGAVSGHYATIPQAMANCPVGAQFGTIIEAPDCWDGKNLDSANHRDHVAYSSYGTWGYLKCPTTHPFVIPQFTLGSWFTTDANKAGWRFSSDDMLPTLPHGTTFHADFFMAWEPTVKQIWHDHCIDKRLNCSGGQLGNGQELRQFAGFRWTASPRLVVIP